MIWLGRFREIEVECGDHRGHHLAFGIHQHPGSHGDMRGSNRGERDDGRTAHRRDRASGHHADLAPHAFGLVKNLGSSDRECITNSPQSDDAAFRLASTLHASDHFLTGIATLPKTHAIRQDAGFMRKRVRTEVEVKKRRSGFESRNVECIPADGPNRPSSRWRRREDQFPDRFRPVTIDHQTDSWFTHWRARRRV